jgi:hypothetical protein
MYSLSVAIAIESWCHLAIAIDCFYLSSVVTRVFGNPHDEAAGINDSINKYNWHHRLAGHTSQVGNMLYGNSAVHRPNLINIAQHNYLRISQQWHHIACLGDGPPPAQSPEFDIDSSISAVVAVPAVVFDLAAMALMEHLRAALINHMLDSTADFRSDA